MGKQVSNGPAPLPPPKGPRSLDTTDPMQLPPYVRPLMPPPPPPPPAYARNSQLRARVERALALLEEEEARERRGKAG